MKRPSDVAKWDGCGFNPDRVKTREPWGKRMERREREFEKAPIETLLTMAKVAGMGLGPLGSHVFPVPITRWYGSRNKSYTKYLAIPLTHEHAAIWSPEAGIKVVDRRIIVDWVMW